VHTKRLLPDESLLELREAVWRESCSRLVIHEQRLASRGLAFGTFQRPTEEGSQFDLIEAMCLGFFWHSALWRLVFTVHVTAMQVVIFGELHDEIIQMRAIKENKL
jgi:hypothetical protein